MSIEVRVSLAQSDLVGDPRTVALSAFQPGIDTSSRSNSAFVGGAQNLDWNMPGVVYGENILPIANGYTALSSRTFIPTRASDNVEWPASREILAVEAFTHNNTSGFFCLWRTAVASPPLPYPYDYSLSAIYVTNIEFYNTSYRYVDLGSSSNGPSIPRLHVAQIEGSTYLLQGARVGNSPTTIPSVWKYNGTAFSGSADTYPYSGIQVRIEAHCGLGSYRLAALLPLSATPTSVIHYSVPGAPTDFVNYGSGSFIPVGYSGAVIGIYPASNGAILYTTAGAWHIAQTFNAQAPFKATQIPNISDISSVAWDFTSSTHIVRTTAGLFKVTSAGAEPYLPHVYRFLQSEVFTEINTSSALSPLYASIYPTGNLRTLDIEQVAGRYTVITCTEKKLSFVHDTILNRMGLIRLPESARFAVNVQGSVQITTGLTPASEAAIAYITAAGQVLTFFGDNIQSIGPTNKVGTIIIGPFALQRKDRTTTVTEVQITSVRQTRLGETGVPPDNSQIAITLYSSPSGLDKINRKQVMYDNGDGNFLGRITGNYIYAAVEGPFELTNFIATLTTGGF